MNKILHSNAYWMGIVREIAEASTCRVKIGTVLTLEHHIVGIGYLGSIAGDVHCIDKGCLLVDSPKQGHDESGKGCRRTIHSEMNAILKCTARGSIVNGWLHAYTTYQPCLWCLKCLLAIGVRKIVFEKEYRDDDRAEFLLGSSNHWVYSSLPGTPVATNRFIMYQYPGTRF